MLSYSNMSYFVNYFNTKQLTKNTKMYYCTIINQHGYTMVYDLLA